MTTEEDLGAALIKKADSAPAFDTVGLLTRSTADRPRRTHHLQMAAASFAVVAVVGGASLLQATRSPNSHSSSALRGTAATTTAPTPQYLVQTLATVLGLKAGSITNSAGHGGANYASDTLTYDDGGGASLIYVTVAWPADSTTAGTVTPTGCSQDSSTDSLPGDVRWGTEALTCTKLVDGTEVGVGQPRLPTASGQTYGLALNHVSILRPDGLQVTIGAFNEATLPAANASTATTRSTPPRSIADITTAARSSLWSAQVPAAAVAKAQYLFKTPQKSTKTR